MIRPVSPSPYGVNTGQLALKQSSPTQAPNQPTITSYSLPQADLTAAPLDKSAGLLSAAASLIQMLTLLLTSGSPQADRSAMNPGAPARGGTLPQIPSNTPADQRLKNTLAAVANDPEGSKLLAAAKAKGFTIEIGNPAAALSGSFDKSSVSCPHCKAALDAGQQVNGVTLPDQKKIIISPDAPDFEKTVVHELVHAATTGDGNSQAEEGIADVIGYRVANRIAGKALPGNARSIYFNKIANYQNLNGSNDIRSTLARLGINPGI